MKKQNNKCKWYVEPKNSHTNEEIARFLTAMMLDQTAFCPGLTDGKGKPHNVIQLDSYDQVQQVMAKGAETYKFKIYFKPEDWKHISHWTLHVSKSKQRK